MREKLKSTLVCVCLVGAFATHAYAEVDCTGTGDAACAGVGNVYCSDKEGLACPTGAEGGADGCKCEEKAAEFECFVIGLEGQKVVEVNPGDKVDIECYIVGLSTFTAAGLQLDFDCSVPATAGGSAGSGLITVDAPHGPFPGDNTYGFTGLYPINAAGCTVANAGSGGATVVVGVGARLYTNSISYTISGDAAGDMVIDLAGRNKPTQGTDPTRIRDSDGFVVGFNYNPLILRVPTGTCCFGLVCDSGPVSQDDCENNIGGTFNGAAQSCADPSPCACSSNAQCNDNDACTVNQCINSQCNFATPTNCDDNNACTIDSCDTASGCDNLLNPAIDDGDGCTTDSCDTGTGAISNTPVDINDGADCTIDSCDPATGVITHDDINDAACPGGFGDCPQGAFECIDGFCTCSECSPVTLSVDGDFKKDHCFTEGDKVTVNINFPGSAPSAQIAGGQFRIVYDPTCMDLVSVSAAPEFTCTDLADCPAGYTACTQIPGDVTSVCTGIQPWTQFVVDPQIDEVNGVVFLAVGPRIELHSVIKGTNLPGIMASLNFNKIGECNWCDVCFDSVNPFNVRLTTTKGDLIDVCDKAGCSPEVHDNGDLVFECPGDVEVNSDCDAVSASASWASADASDTCEGDLDVNCVCSHDPPHVCTATGERCNYLEVATNQCGPSGGGECAPKFDPIDCGHLCDGGGTFPQGRFNFSACAKPTEGQPCSNGDCCEWTVTVTDRTTLDVVVQLSPNVENKAFDRCICYELYTSCSPTKFEESCHTQTFGGAFDIEGHSTSALKVPKSGNVVCVTARDRQHSLRAKDDVTCDGVSYNAIYKGDPKLGGNWLIQGNLNRDDVIDILDFGVFLGQLNQNPTPGQDKSCEDNDGEGNTHADLNGDGVVDVSDFTFIQINFLAKVANPCCPNQNSGSVGDEARSEISVADLIAAGMEDLIVADLNNDGFVNTGDMAAYLAGARPAGAKRFDARNGSTNRARR